MQSISQVEPSPISAELRALIEKSARRAAVTAGAMSIANPSAAVYRQTWVLGVAWSQCPMADATTAMDPPRTDSALAATGV